MDDFPAGPASPGPSRPPLSVVIPVLNGGRGFERCLQGLRDSSWTQFELIVVDDGSTDASGELAASHGARVLRHDRPLGPAAARNAGAVAARAPIVFFLDADVVLHRDALTRALAHFSADEKLAGLFGSYDDQPTAPSLISQYRNLLHHFVHQQGVFVGDARPAHTFWTGCGAIRRTVFLDLGGFDPQLYRRPAIEDIELGYRLSQAGHRIVLARDVLATHLKRWSLRQVLRTDLLHRGIPWMLLMLRSRVDETDLNVSWSQRVSAAATAIGSAAACASWWFPAWGLAMVASSLVLLVAANRDFYGFLARKRGWGFAIRAFPLHYLYFCCCCLSVLIAHALLHLPSRRPDRPTTPNLADLRPQVGTSAIPPPRSATARRPLRWTKR